MTVSDTRFVSFVHTMQISVNQKFASPREDDKFKPYVIKDPSLRRERWRYVINPNKYDISIQIESLSELERIFGLIIVDLGLAECDWDIDRVDFTLDTYNSFDDLFKINCYVKELYTISIGCKNAYRIIGDDMRKRSTIVKSGYFELEIYNKHIQSHRTDIPETRIEFRRKNVYRWKKNDLTSFFLKVIASVKKDILSLQTKIDEHEAVKQSVLVDGYDMESAASREGRVLNLEEYAVKYSDFIYTRESLACLFHRFKKQKDFTDWLSRFRGKGHVINMITPSIIRKYCSSMISAIETFVENR